MTVGTYTYTVKQVSSGFNLQATQVSLILRTDTINVGALTEVVDESNGAGSTINNVSYVKFDPSLSVNQQKQWSNSASYLQ